jgi:hypothetical protein
MNRRRRKNVGKTQPPIKAGARIEAGPRQQQHHTREAGLHKRMNTAAVATHQTQAHNTDRQTISH